MSNNSNEKLRQDIENINILNSAKAAMEAVGLPMEKFVAFNETKTKAPVLFSTRLNRAGQGLKSEPAQGPAPTKATFK